MLATRQLGNCGLSVSKLCLGTMNFGEPVLGSSTFTNNGVFDVNSAVSYAGTLNAADGMVDVLAGNTLTISNGAFVVGNDTQLLGNGEVRIGSTSSIEAATGESFDLDSGVLELEFDSGATLGGGGTFTSSGTADLANISLTLDVNTFINNSLALLDILDSTITVNSANFANNVGGTIDIEAQTGLSSIDIANSFTNAGIISLRETGATQAKVDIADGSTLTNTGTVTATEGFIQTFGAISNSASGLILQDSSAASVSWFFDADLNNAGTVQITQAATATVNSFFNVGETTTLTNQAGGTILFDGGGTASSNSYDLLGNIDNQGLISINTVNAVDFRSGNANGTVTVVNSGTIDIAASNNVDLGNASLATSFFNNTGTLNMGANSTLTLQENTANLNAGTDLQMATGAVLSIQDNSVLNLNVYFTNLSGRTLSLDTGGTLAGTGTLINQGQMVSNNGTLSLDGVVRNQIEGGIDVAGTSTLTGSGTIQNEGHFDFTLQDDTIDLTFIQDSTAAGVLRLGGSLSIGGTLVFETGSAVDLDTLVDGEVVTSGSGTIDNSTALDLNFDSFATANITNRSGGLIDLQGGTVSHIISTLFDNQAGATLVASTSQSEIDLTGSGVLQNAGQINVTGFGDSLTVINGELQNSGGIDIALGASVDISGGTLTMLSGGVLTGTGSVTLASEFNVGAGVDFTLTNGGPSLELTSGDIAGTGTLTNDGDITMTTGGAVNIADFTNTGDFKVTAGTGFTVSAGTNFTNSAGGTLTLEGSAAAPGALLQVSSDWTNSGVIDLTSDVNTAHGSLRFFGATLTNLGTLQTSGTSSASPNTFGDALVNSGTIDVNTANFQIGVTSVTNLSGGIVNVEDGNRLLFDQIPGSANVFENQSGGTITLNNTGQFFITNDNVVINDGNLEIGGGELSISGDGTFTQNSNIVLSTSGGKITVGDFGTAGTLNGTGTLTAQANTTLSLDDNGVLALDTDAFGVVSSNNNTFNVDSTLTLNAGSTFDLTGSNNLAGAGVFDNRQDITLDGETIGATFQQTAGTATLGDTVSVNGSFIVDTGAELITDQTDDTVAGTGSIIVRGNAGFDFINIDTSTLTVENGGIANFVGDIDITSTDINFLSGATTNFNGGDGGPIVNVGATGTFSNAGAIDPCLSG